MEERRRISTDAQAFEEALRRVLSDEELVKRFWQRGYEEFISDAGNNASQWIGKRILTAAVIAITVAGIGWLVKTGALK